METNNSQEFTPITVETVVAAPIEKVWDYWTNPEHVRQWNAASEDWETSSAENDLRVGGRFTFHMQAKDGSTGFDFGGVYTNVIEHQVIEYDMGDTRHVKVVFLQEADGIRVVETFDAETQNSADFQRAGWQAILDNFKKYTETV